MSNLMIFVVLVVLFVTVYSAEVRIPLFGGSITIFNNSDGSFTVGTDKKSSSTKIKKHTSFTVRNGTIENFEFSSNATHEEITTVKPEDSRRRPSQQRPKSDVLNALLSMFGRF